MSALAQTQLPNEIGNAVTSISAVARVDYILRFSKHAVVVVDTDSAAYSAVGSQYLANLAANYNAAYLTMSPRLDDIQVRCRLIEQLFGQVLFDPEQSVAVSLINLIKQHQQSISLVVEHAHLLSFQLLHELCQLAEIARKADFDVQVVLLGLPDIGKKMVEHSVLFQKKLSIVDASNGQLISLTSPLFNTKQGWETLTAFKKLVVVFTVLVVCSTAIIYQLYQSDEFKFSQLDSAIKVPSEKVINSDDPADTTDSKNKNAIEEVVNSKQKTTTNVATAEEISILLMTDQQIELHPAQANEEPIAEPVMEQEIKSLDAMVADKNSLNGQLAVSVNNLKESSNSLSSTVVPTKNIEIAPVSYFQNKNGYVLQLAVISLDKTKVEFITEFSAVEMYQYQRLQNEKIVTVFTTKVFTQRADAEQWLKQAPSGIQNRNPFIKSVDKINAEIQLSTLPI